MLSRVAENLYWLSRYIERAENLARMLDVAFYLDLDHAGLAESDAGTVEGIMTILACRTAFQDQNRRAGREEVLRFLTFDRSNSQSLLGMIAQARENARGTQQTLSADAWSHVNRLHLYLSGPRALKRFEASPPRFFDSMKRACILAAGLIDSTQPRNEVFHFLQIGRYLERVDQMSRIVNAKSHTLHQGDASANLSLGLVHWTGLLRSCSAYEAYLRTHRNRIDPESVVRYLVLDAEFPRAVRFGVVRCRESLHAIAGGEEDRCASEAERQLGRLDSDLRYLEVAEIFDRGLSRFLVGIQSACARIASEIQQAYFVS
jgi:uncharacterized alpha-E superfamily protein